MDLRVFYQKLRKIEEEIAESTVVVVSHETPDGGKAGRKAEVARGVAVADLKFIELAGAQYAPQGGPHLPIEDRQFLLSLRADHPDRTAKNLAAALVPLLPHPDNTAPSATSTTTKRLATLASHCLSGSQRRTLSHRCSWVNDLGTFGHFSGVGLG